MDAGFDENKAEFGIFVLSVALEMLANSDSLSLINHLPSSWANGERLKSYLLDQHVEVLGYLWSEACYIEITPSVKDQAEAKLYCMRHSSGAEALSHGMYRTVRLENSKNFVT